MRFIEFNIKYEVTDNSVMFLNYRLDDNGNITNGVLSLRELQHGYWHGKLEVSDDYASVVYGYELRAVRSLPTNGRELRILCVSTASIVTI